MNLLERDTERNIAALDIAEQQLAYWQEHVTILRNQLEAKRELARIAAARD